MAIEIERKFLTQAGVNWALLAESSQKMMQGYLANNKQAVVRVRIVGEEAFLTIKGENIGLSRQEFEYPIPLTDAESMMGLCQQPVIEKIRYRISQGELCWEIDVFAGLNQGLVVAEIELPSEDYEFEKPYWLGIEVSNQVQYYNSNLISKPYTQW